MNCQPYFSSALYSYRLLDKRIYRDLGFETLPYCHYLPSKMVSGDCLLQEDVAVYVVSLSAGGSKGFLL